MSWCLTGGIQSIIIITKGKAIHLPPPSHHSDQSGSPSSYVTAPLFLAQLLSPQVCCGLFLNSCYSGATVCAWNIKHSPTNSLSLIPSLTVGNCSHHQLTSIRRAEHTSVKCQPKSPRFSSWLSCLPYCTLSCTHTHKQKISLLSFPIHF